VILNEYLVIGLMTVGVQSTIDGGPFSSLWQLAWTSVHHTDCH